MSPASPAPFHESCLPMADKRPDKRLEKKPPRIDFLALGVFLWGLVAAVAVFSYEPGAPRRQPTSNLLGPAGDWLAGELYLGFASAVYVVLAAWFVLVLFLLMRKS